MPKKKCAYCKERFDKDSMVHVGIQSFCTDDHRKEYMIDKKLKNKSVDTLVTKGKEIKRKEQKRKDKQRLKELRSRGDWFSNYLQPLVNQYVRDVIHADQPCYTCGNTNGDTKMNAGHYKAVGRGGADRRRFMHENIKRQCEYCNTHLSGAPVEYRQALIRDHGLEWVEWLENESNHPTLKDQFPTWQDIEREVLKYRILLREANLTPCR